MPFLHSNDLITDDFISLVQKFTWPEGALLMAFSPSNAYFDLFRFDESFLLTTDQGRIFSPEGELRWRRLSAQVRVVYLGNVSPPVGLIDCSSKTKGLVSKESEVILWGKRTKLEGKWINEWLEQQVPHRFVYPVSGKDTDHGRVVLVVENWLDSAGLARFSRYKSLKETSGET